MAAEAVELKNSQGYRPADPYGAGKRVGDMEHRENEVLLKDQYGDLLVTYKHQEGAVAYRISQQALARLSILEDLVVDARAEIMKSLEDGVREETGELVINRSAARASVAARLVVTRGKQQQFASVREGRAPRKLVLANREMRTLKAWQTGAVDVERAALVIEKLIKRTRIVLLRDCRVMQNEEQWDDLPAFIRKDLAYRWHVLRIRALLKLHRLGLLDGRSWIDKIAWDLSLSFKRRNL
jgi:Zn-dependent peptidase ImmA (M78 family)